MFSDFAKKMIAARQIEFMDGVFILLDKRGVILPAQVFVKYFLENYKDTINAVHETHESLMSHRQTEIMKTLTVISVIVFPLTLFAAIFGMNTMNAMPWLNSKYDFWYVIIFMILGASFMLLIFKKKRWL